MQRIADWLEKLGMSEYAARFAENAIDLSVLPDLTNHDLEKIGVLLGHRWKMLRAIGELGDKFERWLTQRRRLVMTKLADVYDKLPDRAEARSNGDIPLGAP